MNMVLKILTVCSLLSLSVFSQENRSNKDLMKKEKKKDVFNKLDTNSDEDSKKAIGQITLGGTQILAGGYIFNNGIQSIFKAKHRLKPKATQIPILGVWNAVGGAYLIGGGFLRIYLPLDGKDPGHFPLLRLGASKTLDILNYLDRDKNASGEITESDKVFTKEEGKINISSRDLKKEVETEGADKSSGETSQKKV